MGSFRTVYGFLLLVTVASELIEINNVLPRRDTHGNILNAHDGHIVQFNGTFWLFGTSYTHCYSTDRTHPYTSSPPVARAWIPRRFRNIPISIRSSRSTITRA